MAKTLLNEAERYLIQNWADARDLEKAMEEVREKYKLLFQQIIEAVTGKYPELDAAVAWPTQFFSSGCVGFSRKSWPAGDSNWPPGLWMWDVRLEYLAAADFEPPSASIWLQKKLKLDREAAHSMIREEAKKLLTPEDLKNSEASPTEESLIWFPAPSKRHLLDALLDGDGEAFVKIFVAQFDMMARFVPVLDKVFSECMAKV